MDGVTAVHFHWGRLWWVHDRGRPHVYGRHIRLHLHSVCQRRSVPRRRRHRTLHGHLLRCEIDGRRRDLHRRDIVDREEPDGLAAHLVHDCEREQQGDVCSDCVVREAVAISKLPGLVEGSVGRTDEEVQEGERDSGLPHAAGELEVAGAIELLTGTA